MLVRRPRGYVGNNHVTIGSDLLAVLAILKLPDDVLGPEDVARLRAVEPRGWYPIRWLLDLMEKLETRTGHYGLIRLGRKLFDLSHKAAFLKVATSARDAVYGLDAMYHSANRGIDIGGWKVLRFEPGYAVVEKTTPHHCVMEQGILLAAITAVGCPGTVAQERCFRRGDDVCTYTISSAVDDVRWTGQPAAKL